MNIENSLKFTEQLRILLYKTGVTQTALAEGIGVSKQVISKWLAGQSVPDIVSFKRIAEFFDVPYDYLYGDDGNKALWDLKPEFGIAVAKGMKEKGIDIEEIQRKTGINQGFINRLIKYGKSKKAESLEFEIKNEFGIRALEGLCELLEIDINEYAVLNRHSVTISPYKAEEEAIIKAYRKNPNMQEAVKKLLSIQEGE